MPPSVRKRKGKNKEASPLRVASRLDPVAKGADAEDGKATPWAHSGGGTSYNI